MWHALWDRETGIQQKSLSPWRAPHSGTEKPLALFVSKEVRELVITFSVKTKFFHEILSTRLLVSERSPPGGGGRPAPWEEIATHSAHADVSSGCYEIILQ